MVFLSEILKPVQDVCKAMKTAVDSDKLPQKETIKEWLTRAEEAAAAIHRRTFIMMTAQERGWVFARKLDFYESGFIICVSLL